MITVGTDDTVLMKLIEITLNSIVSQREIFHNPLDEPYFWRTYFRKWVEAGLAEARKLNETKDQEWPV